MDERWTGNLFQKSEAADEKDFDFAIVVLRDGTHILCPILYVPLDHTLFKVTDCTRDINIFLQSVMLIPLFLILQFSILELIKC